MELRLAQAQRLTGSAEARTTEIDVRGTSATAVYRRVDEQWDLRVGRRALGSRLGVYEVLQALPLGEWVPVESLTDRERHILPALPPWTRRLEDGQLLRLVDLPVRLDLLIVRSETWRDAIGRAAAIGPVAPRMALCPDIGGETDLARAEASFHEIGLTVLSDDGMRNLVPARPGVPEPVVSLHWRLAERVFAQTALLTAPSHSTEGNRTDLGQSPCLDQISK